MWSFFFFFQRAKKENKKERMFVIVGGITGEGRRDGGVRRLVFMVVR